MNIVVVDRLFDERCEKEEIRNYTEICVTENLVNWAVFFSKFFIWIIRTDGNTINRIPRNWNIFYTQISNGKSLKNICLISAIYYIVNSGNWSQFLSRTPVIDNSPKTTPIKRIIYSERLKFSTKLLVLSNITTNNLVNYLSHLLCSHIFRSENKENSGNYATLRPEFSNGQFGKTDNTVSQIICTRRVRKELDRIMEEYSYERSKD